MRALKSNFSNGFTLVELLVVMGIIAVLAAVSLAALGSAIALAKRAKCSGNLHAIGVALNTFAGDNNEQYPQTGLVIALGAVDPGTGKASWMEQLDPYDGANHQIFFCPACPAAGANDYYHSAWSAYYANGMQYPTPAVNILRIKNASAMILAGDSTFGVNTLDADPDDAGVSNNPFLAKPWHGKFYNFVFVDGHCEAVTGFDSTTMTNRYEGVGYNYNSTSPTPP